MSKRTVDDLLCTWASRHAPPEAEARGLAARVCDALPPRHVPAPDDGAEGRARGRLHIRLAWAAVAATLLVVAAALFLMHGIPSKRPAGQEAAWLSSISKADVERSTRLFRELETLFAGDLRSAVESRADVRLSIAPLAGGPSSDAVPLLARLTVAFRKRGDAAWRKPLEADILCRTEEIVETVPDPRQGNRVVFWACSLPDGKVAVDTRLRLFTPVAASADLTAVLTPGKPKQLLALETDEGECRVLLIVVPLSGRRGSSCSDT